MDILTKDFDKWNELKKKLHLSDTTHLVFNEGEIWWCSIGLNIGSEQDGKNELFERPGLVLMKFNDKTALIIPLTSIVKKSTHHFTIGANSAILSQIRLVSIKRFQRFVRVISDVELREIKQRITAMITGQ